MSSRPNDATTWLTERLLDNPRCARLPGLTSAPGPTSQPRPAVRVALGAILDTGEHEVGAFAREGNGDDAADTRVRLGDQRDATGQNGHGRGKTISP